MVRRIGMLCLGTLAAYLVMLLPMRFLVKEPPVEVIALAAAICVVPGLIVLLAAHRLRDKPPEVKIVAVLLTTVVRMVLAIGGGVILYNAVPLVREHATPFISWAIVFYLATLFIETGLLYTDSSGSASQGS